jgi:hypothetical protein
MAYDLSEAFEAIEDELISSMMRNLKLHQAEESRLGFEWEQWQALQLRALEDYRRRNMKKFPPRFNKLNAQIEEALRKSYGDGRTAQERKILQAIQMGFKPSKMPYSGDMELEGSFFGVNERKLDALINAVDNDMERAEYAVLRRADDQYRQVIFNSQVYANTGAGTYQKAVDMATRDFLRAGLDCVEYKDGSRHTLEDYADMAIRTANKRAYLQGEGSMRDEWGIPTVIMNKRSCPCPRCAPFVGKVFIDDVWSGGQAVSGTEEGISPVTGLRYPLLSAAIKKGLYHPRCKDVHSTYFEGITTPPEGSQYTADDLDAMAQQYETEQKQGYCERQEKRYDRMSRYSLDEDNKRIYGARAKAFGEKAEQFRRMSKMSKSDDVPSDLSSAVPILHTEKEFEDIIQYANDKGINVYDVKKFDGDISVLKDQIDALYEVRQEYALSDKLTITFRDMITGDLAETSKEGSSVIFDRSALRNRRITNKYLSADNYLATNDAKGIGYHESGHLISKKYGEKGFDIAKKAYYNIYNKDLSDNEMLYYLKENVSTYSVYLPEKYADKSFRPKYYKEITPEVLSMDKTKPNEFTKEFIRLLKGACNL